MCPRIMAEEGQAEEAAAAWGSTYNLRQWCHVPQPLFHGREGLSSLAQAGADGGVKMNLCHLVRCSHHSGFPEQSSVPT
jgi:hypothetical protein